MYRANNAPVVEDITEHPRYKELERKYRELDKDCDEAETGLSRLR
jgi:hypothetical protein